MKRKTYKQRLQGYASLTRCAICNAKIPPADRTHTGLCAACADREAAKAREAVMPAE